VAFAPLCDVTAPACAQHCTFPSLLFTDTPTTEIYTLSLHDALPIYRRRRYFAGREDCQLFRKSYPPCSHHPRGGISILLFQQVRSEEHTSELQSRENLVCRLLLEKKKKTGQL